MTGRIRWEREPNTNSIRAFAGHVGTIDRTVFSIIEPDAPGGEFTLTTALTGMGSKRAYGAPGELKREAERWLAEFAASLGAIFPPAVEWGIRFTTGGPHESPAHGEEDARDVLANMREIHPEWNAVLLTRTPETPAGPWVVVEEDTDDD